MIGFTSSGSFERTRKFLEMMGNGSVYTVLEKYGQIGVEALRAATPADTGTTAESWYYTIEEARNSYTIQWRNSNLAGEITPVAILIQYGHGTGTGGYVQGRDFINPAMQAVFQQMADDIWKAVQAA